MIDEKDAPLFNIFLQQIEVFTQQDKFLLDLLNILRESFHARACSVRLVEDDKLSPGVAVGYKYVQRRNQSIPLNRQVREILRQSEPFVIPEIQTTTHIPKQRRLRYLNEGFKSCVFVPLKVDTGPGIGILSIYFSRARPIGPVRLQALGLFARMFAYILHKSVLYEDILELKQLIQNVVEFATDAILLTDELGKILYVSRQAARLFRKRVHSLLDDYIFQFDQSQNQTIQLALKQARRKRSLINFESKIQLPNGQELYLQTSITQLQLHRTKREVFLWLIRDTTSLYNAEKELNYKKEELEDFVYSVSHDLKSPIVSLQGYASLLREDLYPSLDQTHQHYFDRIVTNINMMQRMINDLLELSRIGRIDTHLSMESVGHIVRNALEEFHFQIEKRGVKIITPTRFPRIRCNRKGLTLVFSNLLSNAVKFMGEQKRPVIEIGYSRHADEYVFFVRDNGIGMSEMEQKKIFHVFYRSQVLKGVEGTGIGLTMAKKVVQYHGGSIWVESLPGKGSTFYFSLPKVIPDLST